SGRTKDKNIGYIAEYLTALGIDLREVRVVGDEEGEIVAAVNALRARYTYVFTTGGIGPTHDDITAECVAKAFGVPIDYDPRAAAIPSERPGESGEGHPDVGRGRYQFFDEQRVPKTKVVLRAREAAKLAAATRAVEEMLKRVRGAQ